MKEHFEYLAYKNPWILLALGITVLLIFMVVYIVAAFREAYSDTTENSLAGSIMRWSQIGMATAFLLVALFYAALFLRLGINGDVDWYFPAWGILVPAYIVMYKNAKKFSEKFTGAFGIIFALSLTILGIFQITSW